MQSELQELEDLLVAKQRTTKEKSTTRKIVDLFNCTTTVHIPASERKFSEVFAERIVVVTDTTTNTKTSFDAWVVALFSKNPKYDYLYSTKSNWSNIKQFWFLDKSRNVKVVVQKAGIYDLVK